MPSGYRLRAPEERVEHLRFAALRAAAKEARDREDPLAAKELLDEALGLWRGEPFRELEDDDWARARSSISNRTGSRCWRSGGRPRLRSAAHPDHR